MTSMASSRAITEPNPPAEGPEQATAVVKRRAKPYLILGAIVAVGLVAYFAVSWFSRGKESTDDAQVDADVVTISARVGAAVFKVFVTDNQQVHKGDALVELDPADLAVKEKQAAAEVAAATAQAAAADAPGQIVAATSKGSAGAQIDAAKAALSRSQSESARADVDLARAESLRKDEAIPQAQVDTARANDQAAHAAVAKANADLAHARADAAEAQLAEAKLQLSYTHIVAPADGLLSRMAVREG